MAIHQRRISCQGFAQNCWVPLTIDDRVFWISNAYAAYRIYSKIIETSVLTEVDQEHYMGGENHQIGKIEYKGFSVTKYITTWKVACGIDDQLVLMTLSEKTEEVISKETLINSSCFMSVMCYSAKDNLHGIVYSLTENEQSYVLLTSDFVGYTLFSLGKLQPIWGRFKISGSEYYLDTYIEISAYLIDNIL